MTEAPPTESRHSGWVAVCLTAILGMAAAVAVGYWGFRGLQERDTEAMESPLMLSVARQLTDSPRELYGPYGGSNPLVLIHAPLYYRAAALAAWPMARAGLRPVVAARVAGRLISALGLAAALAAAYRLGRLGGLPRRAGWWSALLLAASPLLGGQPFAVRPDMLGVALQSWGLVLALESVMEGRRRLGWASVLFGLAICVKQHLLVGWAVGSWLAARGWMRGQLGFRSLAWLVVPGLSVAILNYGAESVATGGRVWEAAFVVAAHVGRVHPGDWHRAAIVLMGVASRSAGLVTAIVAALILPGGMPNSLRRVSIGAATVATGAVLATVGTDLWAGGGWTSSWTYLSVGLTAAAVLPTALWARFSSPERAIDAVLWAGLAAEVALMIVLSRVSTGAWHNYAIPATVFASAVASRGLARATMFKLSSPAALPALFASLVVLVSCVSGVQQAREEDRVIQGLARALEDYLRRPRSAYFFAGRPGLNRTGGRLDLVYDDWLYPVFESLGLAENPSRWLHPALASGTVRVIVNNSARPVLEGTTLDLRRMGYHADAKMEPYFYVWIR